MTAMKTEQLVPCNCGVEAGSSQGHKHLQMLPNPEIDLFLDTKASSDDGLSSEPWSVPGVPFKHFALRYPQGATAQDLLSRYEKLLEKTTDALLGASAKVAYSVVIRKPWILLIPRTHASKDGHGAINSAGILGLV